MHLRGGLRACHVRLVGYIAIASYIPAALGAGYVCPQGSPGWPCLRGSDGKPLTIRVQYMEKQFVTVNSAAVNRAAELGVSQSCTDAKFALPECFNASNWDSGWLGSFMHKALTEMGVNIIATTTLNTSAQAKALYKGTSSFTRCVWDVKLGHVDLCVGDFWETPERRNLSEFTTSIDSDSFNMFTKINPQTVKPFTVYSYLNIFAPFDNAVWLLMAIMFCFNGFAIWLIEAPYCTDQSSGGILKSVYYSCMAFVGGDVPATIWPSRVVAMGFMFFVYIHVTSYVASLASLLVTNSVNLGQVTSLADVISKGKKLCLYQSMSSATSAILGDVVQRVEMDNYGPMLEKLYEDNCSAAVVGRFESTTFITASNVNFTVCEDPRDINNFATCTTNTSYRPTNFLLNPNTCGRNCQYASRFCSFVNLNDPTISQITLAWQMPVRKDLEPWVSAEMLKLHMQGYLSTSQQAQLLDLNPMICPPPQLPSQSLDLQDMCGTYFFGGIFMILGVIVHILNLLLHLLVPAWRSKSNRGGEQAAPKGKVMNENTANGEEIVKNGRMSKYNYLDEDFRETEDTIDTMLAKVKWLTSS